MNCLKQTWETLIYKRQPTPPPDPDPIIAAKLIGRQYKCRVFGLVMLIAAVVAAVVGLLFISQTFPVSAFTRYFYTGTFFTGSVLFLAIAILGLGGNHAQHPTPDPPKAKKKQNP